MRKLNINGKEYPFRLELGGMRLYAIKKGLKKIKTKDLGEMMTEADMIEDYPIMIWAGLKAGPGPDQDKFDHTVPEVKEWLENDPAAFDRAIDLINEDMEAPEGNEKKKAKESQ